MSLEVLILPCDHRARIDEIRTYGDDIFAYQCGLCLKPYKFGKCFVCNNPVVGPDEHCRTKCECGATMFITQDVCDKCAPKAVKCQECGKEFHVEARKAPRVKYCLDQDDCKKAATKKRRQENKEKKLAHGTTTTTT